MNACRFPYSAPLYFNDQAYYRLPPVSFAWPAAAQISDTGAVFDDLQRLTFVLVHGSWADASFWDEVAAELRRYGHTVYVPEYPGHGADPNKDVTHAMIVDSVTNYITSRRLQDVVLVAHSFGGTVIQKVAECMPSRLKRLVFMNAFVLKDGQSLSEVFPPPVLEIFQQLRQSSGNDTIMLPFPLYREKFANLAPLKLAQSLYSRISPEPAAPAFTKLDLSVFYGLPLPKSYLYLTEDNVLPQTDAYSFHPQLSNRLGLFRFAAANGDHMSTVKTEPARIAWKLYEASRD